MRVGREVTVSSGSAGKLSLGDVRAFVAEMDQAGAAESTLITATVRWGGWLKSLKATAARFGDPVQEPDR
jgi:hypothetical protein